MLKRPSSRRKSTTEGVTLNLVPVIDTMVALIGFMLFTMAFLSITSIESPLPVASQSQNEQELKEKPLQLTLSFNDAQAEIWSPFDRIQKKTIPNPVTGEPDLKTIHDSLVAIKKDFPYETKIVLAPYANASYDVLISLMDASRIIDPTDPPLFRKNQQTGIDEPIKQLFPDVIFGNLLGAGA